MIFEIKLISQQALFNNIVFFENFSDCISYETFRKNVPLNLFGNGLPSKNRTRFLGKGIVGYARYMKFKHDLGITQNNHILQRRLEAISFFDKYGLSPTLDAFKISKSTIYLWRATLKRNKYRSIFLIPKSTRPKNTRRMIIEPLILKFIKDIRENTYRMGKSKIKFLLDEYCKKNSLSLISESLIGKIIKRNNWYLDPRNRIYHDPNSGFSKRKKAKRLRAPKERITYPGQQVQIDSIARFDLNLKRYIITAIDLYSRFSFAYTYKSLSSSIALDFYKKLEKITPFKIQAIKTDNGLEFLGHFDGYLKRKGVYHFFSYPRTPKSNAYIERFNRTLQDEFVDRNIDTIEDTNLFNDKLIDYLILYNSVRPHKSLNNLTPMGHLVFKGILSKMSVTHTHILFVVMDMV